MTLGLLHGCLPDALVLCHRAGATSIDDYPETPIPPLPELIALYEGAIGWVRPARVAAIALNTRGLDDDAARAARRASTNGLPADGDRALPADRSRCGFGARARLAATRGRS